MVSLKLLIYLSIGTLVMLLPILMQVKLYGIKVWKSIPIAIVLTISGTIGTYIWFYIENHWIGGTSFYGAVFVVPVIFIGVAKVLKLPYWKLLDISAPAECAMLMVMKIQCLISGCCSGMELFITEAGTKVFFPSQIMEFLNAFIIMVILLLLSRKGKHKDKIYPLYMIVYGVTRFILNIFRESKAVFLLGMTAGAMWSICSLMIGTILLLKINHAER